MFQKLLAILLLMQCSFNINASTSFIVVDNAEIQLIINDKKIAGDDFRSAGANKIKQKILLIKKTNKPIRFNHNEKIYRPSKTGRVIIQLFEILEPSIEYDFRTSELNLGDLYTKTKSISRLKSRTEKIKLSNSSFDYKCSHLEVSYDVEVNNVGGYWDENYVYPYSVEVSCGRSTKVYSGKDLKKARFAYELKSSESTTLTAKFVGNKIENKRDNIIYGTLSVKLVESVK